MKFKVKRIQILRLSRESATVCDKFTSWTDRDGETRQGFIRDTGLEVWYRGAWEPQYNYQGLGEWPCVVVGS